MEHFYHNIKGFPNQLPRLYKLAVSKASDGFHFVEIGCYRGASAAAMCVEIINSGKNIKFDCIDIWLNDDEMYQSFLQNLEPVKPYFNPIRMPSIEAANLYPDESLDLVCIDASHNYEDVKADINAWLPKVKPGGILAGDDYYYPGVFKAVKEAFPEYQELTYTWMYIKPS